jgi:signal peptidase I
MKRHKTFLLALVFGGLIGCNGGGWASGDRVLVGKCLYDTPLADPGRYDVVVFKYPLAPMDKNTPKNYIKRLIGLPGEIIAIFFGQLYRCLPEPGEVPYDEEDKKLDSRKLWQNPHENETASRKLFDAGRFEILRKPPDVIMALRRNVFDNDFQPKDLVEMGIKRWDAARTKGWKEAPGNRFTGESRDGIDWLRYQHLVVRRSAEEPAAGAQQIKPQLITDFMGYNGFQVFGGGDRTPLPNWVGDLMLECKVETSDPNTDFWLELSQGSFRYRARWRLGHGGCTLFRIHPDGKEEELATKPSKLKAPGTYFVRFANVDSRLTVWVDREMPFDEGVAYPPPEVRAKGEKITDEELKKRRGPTKNDLEPASVGSQGRPVAVGQLRLWRDTYYTTSPRDADYVNPGAMPSEAWSDPTRWDALKNQDFHTWYVQPGHYLCLGDNSTASSDSREWGLVPSRLMLGRALLVYFPFNRAGPIR